MVIFVLFRVKYQCSFSDTQGYTSTYQGPPAYRSPEPPSSPPPPYSLPNTIYPSHPQYLP
jgi:hypothetical protein